VRERQSLSHVKSYRSTWHLVPMRRKNVRVIFREDASRSAAAFRLRARRGRGLQPPSFPAGPSGGLPQSVSADMITGRNLYP